MLLYLSLKSQSAARYQGFISQNTGVIQQISNKTKLNFKTSPRINILLIVATAKQN